MIRPPIGIGDLARALKTLAPQDAGAKAAIAASLGFSLSAEGRPAPFTPEDLPETPEPHKPPPAADAHDDVRLDRPFTVEHRGRRTPAAGSSSGPLIVPRVVTALAQGTGEGSLEPPPLTPLLTPQWTRAVTSTLARTWVESGDVDVAQLVDVVTRRQPISRVPRRPVPTVRRGVQLLVDVGEGMMPFWRDQEMLTATARRVIGDDLVSELRFVGSPLAGCWDLRSGVPAPYRPPASGTPVLLLTALNILRPPAVQDRASDEEWLAFAETVRRGGCAVTALVPYTQDRWPRALKRVLPMVCWDRSSDVRSVLRIARARQRSRPWAR